MTDRELAEALLFAHRLEAATMAVVKADDLAERDAALNVMRLVRPMRQKLETWISLRALRTELDRSQTRRVG